MFCKNCGAEFADGLKYCPNCGKEVDSNQTGQGGFIERIKKHKKGIITTVIILAVFVCFCFIMGVVDRGNSIDFNIKLSVYDISVIDENHNFWGETMDDVYSYFERTNYDNPVIDGEEILVPLVKNERLKTSNILVFSFADGKVEHIHSRIFVPKSYYKRSINKVKETYTKIYGEPVYLEDEKCFVWSAENSIILLPLQADNDTNEINVYFGKKSVD